MITFPGRSVFAAFLFLAAGAAGAATPFPDYTAAVQQFEALSAKTADEHRMPRLSDPGAREILGTLADHTRFLDAYNFGSADLSQLMNMCNQANKVVVSYMLFDLASHVDKTMTDPQKVAPIVMQLGSRNMIEYQSEMTPVMAFNQRCMARQIPLTVDFVRTLRPEDLTEIRLQGLQQLRNGLLNTYLGMAHGISETPISLENRRIMFSTLAEVTPVLAQALDLARRKAALNYWVSQAANMPPGVETEYKQIVDALGATTCDDFCQLPAK